MSNYPDQSDLQRFALHDLLDYRDACQRSMDVSAQQVADANRELASRFAATVKERYAAAGKETGAMTIKDIPGLVIAAKIGETVKWDSDKLQSLAGNLSWDDVRHWFDIKFSVKEAKYNAMPPGEFRDAVTAARTTKIGDLQVKVEAAE